jgi:hypothetical protein
MPHSHIGPLFLGTRWIYGYDEYRFIFMCVYCGCDRAGQLGERGHSEGKDEERVVAISRFQGCSPHLCRLSTMPF